MEIRVRDKFSSNPAISLPPELKRYLTVFCLPATLAALARVHTSFRAAAELALYEAITLFLHPQEASILINTLKTCSQKAALIRSLTIEFPVRWNWDDDASEVAVGSLCDGLLHMHSLTDLRVLLYRELLDHEVVTLQNRFETVLSEGKFRLRTLHCPAYFNFPLILRAHSESLRTLGLRSNGDPEPVLRALESISDLPRTETNIKPMLFAFERDTYLPEFNVLNIFPSFSQDNPFSWTPIINSYESDRALYTSLSKEAVSWVRVYLEDTSKPKLLRSLVTEMSHIFPNVSTFEVLFKNTPEESFYREMAPILSPIALLQDLTLGYWSYTMPYDGRVLPVDEILLLARMWSDTCPELQTITLLDGSVLNRHDQEWRI